ncbi:hypothetical protein [Micromonospora aurantiaca (nom. illeg.)]|uniref:hypothetical protein n=1 Tax=Micromonospora aurantiaca (nom. illeg.) TaxID=47850 RepID=UPI000828DD24|nr:hypothetical protein [Micromonospora aurantiaca]SCL21322.1 hypothetical protein GA0070615_0043 [Micromonospora aurantiaca]SCL21458.1 hypothetical protein GA0070615_0077 [Micromonospora aurantiaca]
MIDKVDWLGGGVRVMWTVLATLGVSALRRRAAQRRVGSWVGFAAVAACSRPAPAGPLRRSPASGRAGRAAARQPLVTPPAGRYQPATTAASTRPAVTRSDRARLARPRRWTAADRW